MLRQYSRTSISKTDAFSAGPYQIDSIQQWIPIRFQAFLGRENNPSVRLNIPEIIDQGTTDLSPSIVDPKAVEFARLRLQCFNALTELFRQWTHQDQMERASALKASLESQLLVVNEPTVLGADEIIYLSTEMAKVRGVLHPALVSPDITEFED